MHYLFYNQVQQSEIIKAIKKYTRKNSIVAELHKEIEKLKKEVIFNAKAAVEAERKLNQKNNAIEMLSKSESKMIEIHSSLLEELNAVAAKAEFSLLKKVSLKDIKNILERYA